MADYLNVVYSEQSRPYTDYPPKLCAHLFEIFGMRPQMRFLEAGCGRGEFLRHFKRLGLNTFGLDISPQAGAFNPDIEIKTCDIENEPIPYPDDFFDVVYSKSLIEHLSYPDRYLKEALRILKPGGRLLTLVPDWEANHKTYFDDYTHRTPFTCVSLADIYKMTDFQDISVRKFRQLPIVWRYPAMNLLCALIAPFVPVRTEIKFLKWSRELMLIASGIKPGSRPQGT